MFAKSASQPVRQRTVFLSDSLTNLVLFFFRDTELRMVYLIYDEYMQRRNTNYLFYIAIAMILL